MLLMVKGSRLVLFSTRWMRSYFPPAISLPALFFLFPSSLHLSILSSPIVSCCYFFPLPSLSVSQPVTNNNPWMLLYFISFLLIVSFFVLNMFVGVVVENFHKCRQHQEVEEAKRREEKRLRRMEKKRRSK